MSIPLERLETEALDPTEIELAWEEEIRRRLAAYRSGEVQPVSSDDVFAKARALLR
jgi:putative addiction module component (TIGR02574 family)